MSNKKPAMAVFLSFVLVLSAVLGQIPVNTRAAEDGYGISNPVIKDGVTTWDCIWFGNYWQSDEKTKEPIKWRVLSVVGDDAFLLADKNLDCQRYNTEYASVTWATCSLRAWLNSTFYQNAFSGAEQAAVRTTAVVNEDNPSYGIEGGNNTQDKVYLLSIAEACNAAYGFHSTFNEESETRRAKNTEYAKKQGAYTNASVNGWWWLRSPGAYGKDAAYVFNDDGYGNSLGMYVNLDCSAVRPALHINLSSTVWKKADKVNSLGDVIEAETPTSPSPETAKPTPEPTPTISQTLAPTSTTASVSEDLPTKYGISNPVIKDGVTTWDCIWFGNYWQSDGETKEPIKWRVLSVDGDDAFLLADKNLDCQPYNTKRKSVTWENCTLRTWLNSTFYQNAFSGAEQAAVRTTTVVNEDNPFSGREGGNNTQDKVYLLSLAETSNAAYGFNSKINKKSETRYSKNTEYAKAQGAYTNTSGNGDWWLRSPGNNGDFAEGVFNDNYVDPFGDFVVYSNNGVRPALYINLSSTVWKKADKVNSLGDVIEAETPTSPSPETVRPTQKETSTPTVTPTQKPTPTAVLTQKPISTPTVAPTQKPTLAPVVTPTPHVIETPAPTPDVSSTTYGISNPVIKDGATTWDCIWFGNYWQNDGKTKEPIKWRVLSVDGDDAFLLADQSLDCQPYDQRSSYTQTSYPWETCSLRTWLNDAFYKNAFNSAEQSAIRSTLVINEEGTKGGNNTQDKLYLLSVKEAGNTTYGFNNKAGGIFYLLGADETRYSKNTRYANRKGAFTYSSGRGGWWLRTPGQNSCAETVVDSSGAVNSSGNGVAVTSIGVRPVLHLDLSSSVWKRAGKVSSVSLPQETAKPTPAATQTPVASPTDYGISNPVVKDGVTTWDCIWFGNYWQSNGKTKEPIKWRVLSVDGDDAFLLADQNLDCQPYNIVNTSVTWETCWLRTWLNSTFYLDAFNSAEQSAIRETLVVNGRNPFYNTGGGKDTRDNVYLLSIDEARNEAYGFTSEYTKENGTRCSKNTQYAKSQGAYTVKTDNGWWWLRSPGNDSSSAADVSDYGWGVNSANDVNIGNIAVRPALHINLSSSVWKKAGKVDSATDISEADTPALHPAETAKPKDYGIRNPVEKDGVNTWDCVWFGNYWQSDKETKEPIKWRVLSVDGDDAFLLADQNLDCQPYERVLTDRSFTWETCSLRAWLNSEFYQNAFNLEEQLAIQNTLVVDEDSSVCDTAKTNDTRDKIYLLSITEANNAEYGFRPDGRNDVARCAKNTEYTIKQGAYTAGNRNGYWWLRTCRSKKWHVADIDCKGYSSGNSYIADSRYNAVRPVMHINLSSSSWKKAGKVDSLGNIMEEDISVLPPSGTAKPMPVTKPTKYGIGNPKIEDGVSTWNCVWFGNYQQSSEKEKSPIKWRVLSVDGDDAFLLADQNLNFQAYDTKHTVTTWELCSLRTWLNNTFYQDAFSPEEQSAIQTTTVINDKNPYYNTYEENDTQDKVYLLSIAEARNETYGFRAEFARENAARSSKSTQYAAAAIRWNLKDTDWDWWLRSPGGNNGCAAIVNGRGWGDYFGMDVTVYDIGVRPVLHIDLSSNTWSKAGTVSSSGDIEEIPAPTPTQVPIRKAETPTDDQDQSQAVMSDSTQGSVSAGIKIKDTAGVTYTVTSSGSSKSEAAYTAPKNKKVTSVAIPSTVNLNGTTYKVTSIKANAFKKCKKLKKVTIGKNIKTIGKNAFYQCTKLKSITIKTTKLANKTIGSKAFAKLNKKVKIKVPKKKLSAYKKLLKKKGVTGKKQVIKKI